MARAPTKLPRKKLKKRTVVLRKKSVVKRPRLAGIVQGVGKVVSRSVGGPSSARAPASLAFNAFSPVHLPLPRAVGRYSAVRVTQLVSSAAEVQLYGTYYANGGLGVESNGWSNLCSMESVDGAVAINVVNNARQYTFNQMSNAAWNRATLVPSAFSVQVMNPNALQTTAGIVYIGRCQTMPNLVNNAGTWNDLAGGFVAYNQPRLCSAAKLAMRGVQIDAVPFNMNALSMFDNSIPEVAGLVLVNNAFDIQNRGFAPIFVYNPNGVQLQFLVTMEYRARFEVGNPAQATHIDHPVSSDAHWGSCISQMEAMGNGVVDIVDKVMVGASLAMRGAEIAAMM